uniref:Phytocyanin domain-containing protein n=1 Tax=Oryza meridionalis TaxID=40149 RepID=A0A0E0DK23_9ORYZ
MATTNHLVSLALLLLLALFGASVRRAGATTFEVGGEHGWAVPPAKDAGVYNDWASKNRFLVGDSVHFKYAKDSVMVVTEDDYNKCKAEHPIFFSNNGDTEVGLDRQGLFYFISGVAGHCERGQRMVIKVIGHDAPPPASPPPPPSNAPPTPPHPSGAASALGAGGLAVAAMLLPVFVYAIPSPKSRAKDGGVGAPIAPILPRARHCHIGHSATPLSASSSSTHRLPPRDARPHCSSSKTPRPLQKNPQIAKHTPPMAPPLPPTAHKTIADYLIRPSKRLRPTSTAPAAAASAPLSSSSSSSLSPEQRRRADTNLALARARRHLRLAESKASGGAAKLEELLVEETWMEALPGELRKPYALELCRFVAHERLHSPVPVYPPPHLVFHALHATPFDRVKAVIIGQDPYHGPGQAMGLSFSVPEGIKIPSSLANIFKELQKDLVREHQANSHAKKGWEQFTDAVIKTISLKKSGIVFILWGNSAQAKTRLIDETKHHILKSAHPSGLSANRGFFGCRSWRGWDYLPLIGNSRPFEDIMWSVCLTTTSALDLDASPWNDSHANANANAHGLAMQRCSVMEASTIARA